ncbi:TIGR04076 family protein [Candidatus Bathyarchaeota archaeon]|nr:TIGR04076 family protein [Candidatus Bathyarchaeota archaeon]
MNATYGGPCPFFKDGQEFIVEKTRNPVKPEGLDCPYAWDSVFWAVMALRSGADFAAWYKEPGVAIWSCPDGLRSVVFKLERI